MHSGEIAGADVEEGNIALSAAEGAAASDLEGARAGQFGSHAAELVAQGDKKSALMTVRKGLVTLLIIPVALVGAVSLAAGGVLYGFAQVVKGLLLMLSETVG